MSPTDQTNPECQSDINLPFIERRTENQILIGILNQVHNDIRQLDEKLTDHMGSETAALAATVNEILNRSFPEGDPEGHRKAHEETMKALADRSEFWNKLLFEVTKYGLFGVLGWLAYTVWVAFLVGPKR